MADTFDPDAYLASPPPKQDSFTNSGFDPDAYLSGKSDAQHDFSWKRAVTDIPTETANDASSAWDTAKHGLTDAPEPGVMGGIKNVWNTAKGIAALPAIPLSLATGPIHSVAGHIGANVSALMRQGAEKIYGPDKVKKAEEATGTPSDPEGAYESAKGGIDKAMMALGPGKGPAVPGAMPAPPPADLFGVTRTAGEESGDLEAIRREQAAKRDMLGPAATKQATAFGEQRAQQLPAANESVTRQLDPAGNGLLAESPHDAAEIVQNSVQKEAARSKQDVTDAYDRAKQYGGQLHPDAIKDTVVGVREDLNNLPEPVYVDDGTPVAARMLKFLDDRAAKLNIRNDADLANPIPSTVAGVNLEGVNQLRKGLSTMRGDALAGYGTNPSDSRAANAIMKAFDDRIHAAVNDPTMFNGPPEAIQAWNDARALASQRFKTYGNDVVGKKIQAIIGDARIDKDPASLQAVSNAVYGGTGTAPSDMNIAVAKRLQKILGQDSPEWAALRQGYFKKLTTTPEGKNDFSYGRVADNLAEAIDGRGKGLSELLFTPAQRDMLREYGNLHRSLQIPPTGANWSETSTFVNRALRTVSEKLSGMIGAVIGHAIAPGAHGVGEYAGMQLASKGSSLIENAKNARMIKAQMPLVAQRIKQWQQAVKVQQRINNPATASRAALAATNTAAALSRIGLDSSTTLKLLQSVQGPSGPGTSDASPYKGPNLGPVQPKGFADGGTPTADDDTPTVTTDAPPKRIYMNMSQEGDNSTQAPVPESDATLQAQQDQLKSGDRKAQLFPGGEGELDKPADAKRAEMPNGDVYHYNPDKTSKKELTDASENGNENEVLGLGPYNKDEALARTKAGEKPVAVTERKPDGTEVRAAAGTDQTAPAQVNAMEAGKSDGNTIAVENPQNVLNDRQQPQYTDDEYFSKPVAPMPELPSDNFMQKIVKHLAETEFSKGYGASNELAGTGNNERYQTWPERMIRSGVTAAGDALSGELPDLEMDPVTGELHTSSAMIERAQDMAGLAGSGGLGSTGEEAGVALGTSPMLRPALKYNGKIYKAPPGGEHADAMTPQLYNEYQKQALSGEDMSNFDFGFMNHKGQFLNREDALKYGVDNGILNPQAAKQGALTSTILSDSSAAGAPLAALEHAQPFYSAVEQTVAASKNQKMHGEQWANWLKNQNGVKPDELQYTGIDKWLRDQKGPVTKQQVQDFIEKNKVRVNDVVKGESAYDPKEINEAIQRRADSLLDDFKEGGHRPTNRHLDDIWNQAEQEVKEDPEAYGVESPNATKYSSYQLPGGENYREHLLTLPEKPVAKSLDGMPIGYKLIDENAEAKKLGFNVTENTPPRYSYNGPGVGSRIFHSREEAIADAARTAKQMGNEHNPADYKSSHWDEPNILAHVRTNDRDVGGVPALHLEELQSDLHQSGRKNGYKEQVSPEEVTRIKNEQKAAQSNFRDALEKASQRLYGKSVNSQPMLPADQMLKLLDQPEVLEPANKLRQNEAAVKDLEKKQNGVPDMPFKTSWPELAMKRMIQKAASEGKSRISWTPGEAQAARYDLSKQVEGIRAKKTGDGQYQVQYIPKGSHRANNWTSIAGVNESVPASRLPDLVGKELAEKIVNDNRIPSSAYTPYTGLDLKVGGEGMKGFYDQMLPKMVEKLGKQYGVKVKEVDANPKKYYTAEGSGSHYGNWEVRDPATFQPVMSFPTKERAEQAAIELSKKVNRPVHYFDIPPKMKEDVLKKGFPLFSDTAHGAALSALEKTVKDKQGNNYRLEKETDTLGRHHYKAFDTKQPYVPAAMVDMKHGNKKAMYLGTRDDLRRKGLMSALHDHIEKDLGYKLEKDWATTPDGEAFYQNRQGNKQQIERPVQKAKTEPEINVPNRAAGGRVIASNIASPSEAQAKAGNYSKDHVNLWGLNLTIENAKGSIRRGVGPDGKLWACKLTAHYGYVKGTNAADGDHLDIYLGPYTKSTKVYVINQVDLATKKFDETKTVLGAASLQQALNIYCGAFSDGKGAERIGSIVPTNIKTFKEWVKSSDHHKPFVLKKEAA